MSASFALEEFVGNGALLERLDNLIEDGWADVPTLKVMSKEDMELLGLTQEQRDALEIRTYLHDRLLMKYADSIEASGKTLTELLSTSPTQLTNEFKMRRGHVARFLDQGSACAVKVPENLVLPARRVTAAHHGGAPLEKEDEVLPLVAEDSPKPKFNNDVNNNFGNNSNNDFKNDMAHPSMKLANNFDSFKSNYNDHEFRAPVLLNGPFSGPTPPVVSKGIFSAPAVEPRLCGLVRGSGIREEVTPLSILEKIMIQKLTPAYRKGFNPFKKGAPASPLPPPTKASDLWAEKATLILVLRRPGCVMCRAEAHQLYTRKPIFDAMGIQLVVCLNEHIEGEVRAFWPRYWGGMVVVDEQRDFFRALGQGKIPRENYLTGFFLSSTARANFKKANDLGIPWNARGEGNIKGGVYLIRAGSGGVAYQFVERNFGDWAPLDEVLQACANITQRK
ncbi:hypothetical protein M758_3G027500 [Ceratodon purpureus]|nr:hypothetical protein M758_3G027500 [Ceratodon purpureus]